MGKNRISWCSLNLFLLHWQIPIFWTSTIRKYKCENYFLYLISLRIYQNILGRSSQLIWMLLPRVCLLKWKKNSLKKFKFISKSFSGFKRKLNNKKLNLQRVLNKWAIIWCLLVNGNKKLYLKFPNWRKKSLQLTQEFN